MFSREFLGYEKGQVFPTLLCKKLKELDFYNFNIINKTVEKCRPSIEYALQKDFKSELAKISYIFAIIKNNINDVYKDCLREEKVEKKQQAQTTNLDLVDEQSMMNIGSKKKAKDISDFLEDNEWI